MEDYADIITGLSGTISFVLTLKQPAPHRLEQYGHVIAGDQLEGVAGGENSGHQSAQEQAQWTSQDGVPPPHSLKCVG